MNFSKISANMHQFFSFNKIFAKGSSSSSIFWPGCSALMLDTCLIEKTYNILKKHDENIKITTYCCMKPSLYIGSERNKNKREIFLKQYFRSNNIKTIYTLCPNCKETLPRFFNGEIVSVWEILDKYILISNEEQTLFRDTFFIHDPCASRKDLKAHNATRSLLVKRGVDFKEFTKNREVSQCCGRKNMLFVTNPEKSKQILESRIKESHSFPIVSYCESCVDMFLSANQKSTHILEIVFNRKSNRSWKNRFFSVRKL